MISSKVRVLEGRKKFSRERAKCRVSMRIDVGIDLIRDDSRILGPGSRMFLTGRRKPLVLKFGRVPRLPLEKAAGNRFIGRYIASIFKCYIIGLSRDSPIVISRARNSYKSYCRLDLKVNIG